MFLNKKAQSSVEYLIVATFLIIIIGGVLFYASTNLNQSITDSKTRVATQKIASAIDTAYALGPGAQISVTVDLPYGIESELVENNLIGYIVNINGNLVSFYADTKANLNGNLPTNEGMNTLTISVNESGEVVVGDFVVLATPILYFIDLNVASANYDQPILVTGNGTHPDGNILDFYCSTTSSPSITNKDFCESTGINSPYNDISCVGTSPSQGSGPQTIYCALYDGENYAGVRTSSYILEEPPIFFGCETGPSGFFDGDGTDEDPYQICNWEQLNNVRDNLSSSFVLLNNLTSELDDYDDYASSIANGGLGWEPIGTGAAGDRFDGNFDGNGNVIFDLFINRPTTEYIGLFGYAYSASGASGIIRNLGLENIDITGSSHTGALAGYSSGFWNAQTIIENIYVEGSISGGNNTGGIIGYTGYQTLLQNSYVMAEISGGWATGGISGGHWSNAIIENAFSSSTLTPGGGVGGLIGNGSATINNSFWNTDLFATSAGGTGKTTAELKEIETFSNAGWNISLSNNNLNDGYPFLGWQDNNNSFAWLINFVPLENFLFEKRIAQSSDDAEERISNNNMTLNSNELRLTRINPAQNNEVGLRFLDFNMPINANINEAYIEFTFSSTNIQDPNNMVIYGELSTNSQTFTTASGNITNRTKTTSSVTWNNTTAAVVGQPLTTPDLTPIINEIINQPGWTIGSPITFIITGDGRRVVYAYDSSPSQSALLVVDYDA